MTGWLEALAREGWAARLPAEIFLGSGLWLATGLLAAAIFRRRSAGARMQIVFAAFLAIPVWVVLRSGGISIEAPILPPEPPVENAVLAAPEPVSRPSVTVPGLPVSPVEVPSAAEAAAPDGSGWIGVIPAIWGGVFALLLLRMAASLAFLRRMKRQGTLPRPGGTVARMLATLRKPSEKPCAARLHPAVRSPLFFGFDPGTILLPPEAESWSEDRLRIVFRHELAHRRRRDFATLLTAQILASACWPNPLAWIALGRLRVLAEMAADDLTLEQREEPARYTEELMGIVRELGGPARHTGLAIPVAKRGALRRRIVSMLNPRIEHRHPGRRVLGLILAASLLLTAGAAVLRLAHAEGGASRPAAEVSPPQSGPIRNVLVSVRDADGRPVRGAEIRPNGLRAAFAWATHYGWTPPAGQQSLRTGENGTVRIPYPAFTDEDVETKTVTAWVRHPDFCSDYVEIDVANPAPIVLERGARVTVSADTPSGLRTGANLRAAENDYRPVFWESVNGAASARLYPGDYAIQAVGFADDGAIFFGETRKVHVATGEDQTLRFSLKKGETLRGRLSDNVPRPVEGGRVVACISLPADGDERLACAWETWGPVDADGSFALENCPPGEAGLIALCDGFVSKDPKGPRTGGRTEPQVFANRGGIVVAMEQAGGAHIHVLDPDGKPIPGATVSFWPNQWVNEGASLLGGGYDSAKAIAAQLDGSKQPPRRESPDWDDETNTDGSAFIADLPEGTLRYAVKADGYEMPVLEKVGAASRTGEVKIQPGVISERTVVMEKKGDSSLREKLQAAEMPRLSVPPRPTDKTGDPFPVESGERLSGRVVDARGQPLEGVLVDAWTWYSGNETRTDKDGKFDLPFSGETIEVRFSKDGFSPIHVTRQPAGALKKDVVLATKPYFEGVVTDSRGRPVADQLVRATCGPKEADGVSIGEIWTETRTGASGRYRLHLWPDTYRIEVRSAENEVARIEGQRLDENQARTLDIRLEPGVTFRARVVDSETGEPIRGVTLKNWLQSGIEGVSGENGEVKIDGVFPGRLDFDQIEAAKAGYARWWSAQAVNEWERRQIERSGWQRNFDDLEFFLAPESRPAVIEMERGVTIRGTVRDPDGHPVAGATVAPALTGTGNSLTGDTRFSVRSGGDGSFEMLLPASNAAKYNLVAHDGGYNEWRRFANGVLPPIRTKSGQRIENVAIALTRPCVVRGRVVDARGKPVPLREVRAASADMLENRYYFPTALTGEDGSFTLPFVRAGKTLVQVAPFWLDPREAPEGTSVEIDVTESGAADVTLVARDTP